MKFFKQLIMISSLALVLCACGEDDIKSPIILESETLTTESETSTEIIYESTEDDFPNIVIEDDTLPPDQGMMRSPLTNEWVAEEVATLRPIAVMTPNEVSAIPHYNLSKASILYEANVEGRMTRMLAIYDDWTNLDKIGNIRSLRTYYAYWAFEWDAFLVHFGGPFFIDDLLAQETTQNINGTGGDDSAFFRSSDREAPHNAYASGSDLYDRVNEKNYPVEPRDLIDDRHFKFASKLEPNTLEKYERDAKNATYVDMSGCYPLTRCYFEYNEEDGLYYRSQHLSGDTDGPHIDAATGEQLKFKNILVQNTKYEELGEGYLAFQCHDTTRDGWFFTNGKGIHVNWEKTSDYGATRYYDDNGDEIILNTGKTMICIIEEGDSFTFH